MRFQRLCIMLALVGSLAIPWMAQTEEPQPILAAGDEAQVVPKRIKQKRKQARWMVPLLTAQYCANQNAFQIKYQQAQMLLKREVLSQEQAGDETRPYQEGMERTKRELATFGKQPGSCQTRAIQAIIPCLPSVEPLRKKGLVGYLESWCWNEPYLTYSELETGQESLHRHPQKPLDMHVVAGKIQEALRKRDVEAAVRGYIGGRSQILEIVLKKGTEEEAIALLEHVISTHQDLLKKGLYRQVSVFVEGTPNHHSKELPIS